MESRAPYALIGLFMSAAIGAVFGLRVTGCTIPAGLQERATYRIQFENTVAGLVDGAPVLFNGIRVGEVAGLRLAPENPRQVIATIAVAAGAPLRPDTRVGLDFQGLTGRARHHPAGRRSRCGRLAAGDQGAAARRRSLGWNQHGRKRRAMRCCGSIRYCPTIPSRSKAAIADIKTFSAALARNSDRLDPILARHREDDGRRRRTSDAGIL